MNSLTSTRHTVGHVSLSCQSITVVLIGITKLWQPRKAYKQHETLTL